MVLRTGKEKSSRQEKSSSRGRIMFDFKMLTFRCKKQRWGRGKRESGETRGSAFRVDGAVASVHVLESELLFRGHLLGGLETTMGKRESGTLVNELRRAKRR